MINYSATRDELEKIAVDPLSLLALPFKVKGGVSTALTTARIAAEKYAPKTLKRWGEGLAKRVSQSGMRRPDSKKLSLGRKIVVGAGKALKETARIAEPAAVEYAEFTHALGRALGPKAGPAIRRATQTGLKYGPRMTEAVAGTGARRKIEKAIRAVPEPLQRIVSQEYRPLPKIPTPRLPTRQELKDLPGKTTEQVRKGAKGLGGTLKRMFLTTTSGGPVGTLKRSK